MKKNHFTAPVYLLFYLLIFLLSCGGGYNTKALDDNQSEVPTGEQIGDYVVKIFEDSKGHLWFGTMSKGVARCDGKSLVYFTKEDGLGDNAVVNVVEDGTGILWFATHNGLTKYDGKTFITFTKKDGLCHDRVSNLLIDKAGRFWVGTWGGVCRYDGDVFSNFPLPVPDVETPPYQETANWVTEIMEDQKGNIWFGRSGYGACVYDGETFRQFTKKEGLPSNCVQAIHEDRKGQIWFGTRVAERDHPDADKRKGGGGLSRFDGRGFANFNDVEGLFENDVYTIYENKAGDLWVCAVGVGLYQYDGQSFKLYNETDRMDLTSRFGVQGILEDRQGTFWLGFSGGLFRMEGDSIVNVVQEDFQ